MTGPQAPGPPPAFTPQQPVNLRPRSRSGCVTALAIVGAVVVVLVVAGTFIAIVSGGSKSSTGTSGAPTGGGSGAVGTSRTNPAPVGTPVTPAKNWSVRVTSAQLDGDATMKSENVFVSPNSGKQFVIVGISVTNGGDQAATTAGNVKLTLLSPGGVATDASWARPPNQLDVGSQLQPGSTTSGNLAFEVPSADAAASVLLAEPVFTLSKEQDQRFLSLG